MIEKTSCQKPQLWLRDQHLLPQTVCPWGPGQTSSRFTDLKQISYWSSLKFTLPGSTYGDTPDLRRQKKRTCADRYNPVSDYHFCAAPGQYQSGISYPLFRVRNRESFSAYKLVQIFTRRHIYKGTLPLSTCFRYWLRLLVNDGRRRTRGVRKLRDRNGALREDHSARQHRLHYHVTIPHARKSCANLRKLTGHLKKIPNLAHRRIENMRRTRSCPVFGCRNKRKKVFLPCLNFAHCGFHFRAQEKSRSFPEYLRSRTGATGAVFRVRPPGLSFPMRPGG